ncbi:hypothetical protein C8A05DRAFT_47438 [Staphylotrichum tortipilum]|uniref:Arylamine N-acetyltransferase n=1 Tax=Staphylotrichum tortipilum TaxID=2831512 RepID=A0AAN6MBZ7_9PEZI|nr:hypothetical protein C8A05DRAFT_47438 [Staphylotrichum longicolle]
MHTYTDEQLARYFARIDYHHDNVRQHAAEDPLACLTALQAHQMAHVPFESLSLHYARHRVISLNPEELFTKVVDRRRGGYCMELNTLFAGVLRSLGFTLFSAGGRVRQQPDGGYKGWDHMVNIITITGQRYLVDVAFGSHGPPQPVPLQHDYEFVGIAPMRGRLQHRSLAEHTDDGQRVWVYSAQADEAAPWNDMYHFVELEFLPGDFEVMSARTSTAPTSFFVQSVMCMTTVLDEAGEKPVGVRILHRDYVKQRIGAESEIIEKLQWEPQRVGALRKHFGIELSPEEQNGIRGLASELRFTGGHA